MYALSTLKPLFFVVYFFFQKIEKGKNNAAYNIACDTQKTVGDNFPRPFAEIVDVQHIRNRVVKSTKRKHDDGEDNADGST